MATVFFLQPIATESKLDFNYFDSIQGTLFIDFGASSGYLSVTGCATLAGSLLLKLTERPDDGASKTIVVADCLFGNFTRQDYMPSRQVNQQIQL